MRGKPQAQPDLLTVLNLNATVPTHHPLRAIKRQVDAVLQKLSPLFEELYEAGGRPSIPPEQLLKARLLTALYSVRSEWLCFGAHLLMENRNGLRADVRIHDPIAKPGPRVALEQIQAHPQLHPGRRDRTLGTDKAYHRNDFVRGCRARAIAHRVACKQEMRVWGPGRTNHPPSLLPSQPSAADGAAEPGRGAVKRPRRAAGCPSGRSNADAAGASAGASGGSELKSTPAHI
jgi:hypothetical protein